MAALTGERHCWSHSRENAAERAAPRRRGGQQSRTPYAIQPSTGERIELRDVASIRALLERVVADTLQQPNTAMRSRALAHQCLVGLRAHEVGELEERVAALERRSQLRRLHQG